VGPLSFGDLRTGSKPPPREREHDRRIMKRSTDRILTTHAGSLHRPPDLLEMIRARQVGTGFDAAAFDARLKTAVAEAVRLQVENGIDVVSDGEYSKVSFAMYVLDRIDGFGGDNPTPRGFGDRED